jgi:hypothetical protein
MISGTAAGAVKPGESMVDQDPRDVWLRARDFSCCPEHSGPTRLLQLIYRTNTRLQPMSAGLNE